MIALALRPHTPRSTAGPASAPQPSIEARAAGLGPTRIGADWWDTRADDQSLMEATFGAWRCRFSPLTSFLFFLRTTTWPRQCGAHQRGRANRWRRPRKQKRGGCGCVQCFSPCPFSRHGAREVCRARTQGRWGGPRWGCGLGWRRRGGGGTCGALGCPELQGESAVGGREANGSAVDRN